MNTHYNRSMQSTFLAPKPNRVLTALYVFGDITALALILSFIFLACQTV